MICVALGTHEQPFDRALDLVASLPPTEELVIQAGSTERRHDLPATWLELVGYDEMLALLRASEVVVCHAGVGTILSALGSGKRPIVVPRLKRYGEHVDDHQLQITRSLADRELVYPCDDGDDLGRLVDRARRDPPPAPLDGGDLVGAIVGAIIA